MQLLLTDVIAILIALLGASFVIILSIVKYGQLVRQNNDLRKVIKILQMQNKEGNK